MKYFNPASFSAAFNVSFIVRVQKLWRRYRMNPPPNGPMKHDSIQGVAKEVTADLKMRCRGALRQK